MSRLGEARAAKVKRSASVPWGAMPAGYCLRSEEHTSELQSRSDLVCRLLLEKKKKNSEYLRVAGKTHPALCATAGHPDPHLCKQEQTRATGSSRLERPVLGPP